MPPGQTIPSGLSFEVARKLLKPEDMERLACAFLNATSTVNFDAEKAGREFGNVKPESFKRQIWVITKKLKEYAGEGEEGEKAKGKGGRKRKAEGEEGGVKAKRGRGGKKSKAEAEDDADDEVAVKTEQKADEESEGELV